MSSSSGSMSTLYHLHITGNKPNLGAFNPIPAGTPPLVIFLHNSKSIGIKQWKFSGFS